MLMYTSGTTGTPKGVPLTHDNILAELAGVNYVLKLTDKEKLLSLLPLFHAYLQIANLWIATVYGCEVGYLKELTPDELSKAMKEFKPTILTTVPRLWYLFHKKIFDAVAAKPRSVQRIFRGLLALNGKLRDTIGLNIGRRLFGEVHEGFGGKLRVAISAGSRFDEDVAVDFHRLGFTILQGYGLTETSGAATATYEDDNVVGSVGKPMKGAEIKIDKPDGEGVGEVLIKGPMVFQGYYQNKEATAEAFTADGWFRSGDLGRLDKRGHLYIVGRGKVAIRRTQVEKFFDCCLIFFQPLRLLIWRVRPSDIGAFVPIEAHPPQAVQDGRERFVDIPLRVGIVDAQQEAPA